jgi:hypothetical protein
LTAITDDHVEWAVVDRLRRMLQSPPHPEFSVTNSYALFTSILCWTVQRIRAGDSAEGDKLLGKLEGRKVEEPPWSISTTSPEVVPISDAGASKVGPFPDFAGRNVYQFIIDLRNAVAHGDARRVKPFHEVGRDGEQLAGFIFICGKTETPVRTITLLESDMRRIGIALADVFCKALRRSDEHRRDGNFERDAAQIEEAA